MQRRRTLIGLALLFPTLARAQAAPEFDVTLHENEAARVIGRVALDATGHLTLLSTVPERAEWLQRVVAETNGATAMHADAPPPPGAAQGTDASRIVRRGDPDFPSLLRAELQSYYGIELRPATTR